MVPGCHCVDKVLEESIVWGLDTGRSLLQFRGTVSDSITALRAALGEAGSIVALTGAGISAESGIPTFRGKDGLWRSFSPQALATPEAFRRDPKLVWEWYDWRRGLIRKAEPNPGHYALAELERRQAARGGSFTLVTQNVDGLHDRAGSKNVLKLHGDIWQLRCVACGAEKHSEETPLKELPPRCACGGLLRPGVVWFGEELPHHIWEQAVAACSQSQILLVIGTSATVYPAAGLAQVAREADNRVAVVNPELSAVDDLAEWVLRGPSGEILPRLL
jgi:NAD-dependent deacetylase